MLNRNILSTFGNTLHLLQKEMIDLIGIGWEEQSYFVNDKELRPDATCMEKFYLNRTRKIILDVKLSIESSYITIYKYIELFQNKVELKNNSHKQLTFFSQWLPENLLDYEAGYSRDHEGQLNMFLENNILYIAYLIGEQLDDLLPGERISHITKTKGKREHKNGKTLPLNMEVRFLPFHKLPEFYCISAGIEYSKIQHKAKPIIHIAEIFKKLIEFPASEIDNISKQIYQIVKSTNHSLEEKEKLVIYKAKVYNEIHNDHGVGILDF